MTLEEYNAFPLWHKIALVAEQIAIIAETRQPRETKRLKSAHGKLLAIWEQLQTSAAPSRKTQRIAETRKTKRSSAPRRKKS